MAFNEYAFALEGIPHELDGIGKSLVVFASKLGPPRGPLGFRVSTTRHGGTGMKRNAVAVEGLMFVRSLAVSFPGVISPPPETVAEFVTLDGALFDTFTVSVIAG